jgi:cytochrome d ubiquinol oxidase subunit II
VLIEWYARGLKAGLLHSRFALCAEAASIVSLIVGEMAIYRDHVRLARWMVAICAASIVTGWASAQYPYLSRPDMTIFNSVLSENVVRDVFLASIAGAALLFPSLALLFYVFKDQRKQQAIAASQKTQA